jgi:RNA polymerase sigma-70 factor (ECF subfamily)
MQNALSIASEEEPVQDEAGESARDSASFAALVERHARFVYRVALAVTRNAHDAEDAAQETFLQIYRGKRWDQIEDERGYLARLAWRLGVRRCSSPARDEELPEEMASLEAGPEQSAMDSQLEAWFHARIDRLPEKLRQPLALAALGELKLVEIAVVLGIPEGTVRRRIHSARQILRGQFEARKGGRA